MKQLFAVLALIGCASLAWAEDVVRLGNLKFAHYGAVSYMKELAPRYGLRIGERFLNKGLDIMPAIVAGDLDVGAVSSESAIAGRASGVPIYVVAGFAKGGVRIVAGTESGIRSIPDLKGKRVGVTRGVIQELMLYAQLDKHGLTWSDQPGRADVHIIYLGFTDLNAALMTKQIDAMCQSEPFSAQAINKKIGIEIIKPYDTPIGEPVRTLVMSEKFYKDRPDVAQRFMNLFVEATQLFRREPELAEKYVRQNMFKGGFSSQDYLDAMDNADFTVDITQAHMQVTADMMQKFMSKKLGAVPRIADWVRLDLLQRAKADLNVK